MRPLRIGTVPLASPRGVIAAAILGVTLLVVFLDPIVRIVLLILGRPAESARVPTRALLAVNFAFNAVFLVFLPMLAIVVSRPQSPAAIAVRLRLLVSKWTPLHILLGVISTIGAFFLLGLIIFLLNEYTQFRQEEAELVRALQPLLTWPMVISMSLLASVTEEVFFRGLLQPRVGVIAGSILFGLVHIGYGTLLQVAAPFAIGLLFGFLFLKTKSLWTPIAGHFTFDFVSLSSLLLEHQA